MRELIKIETKDVISFFSDQQKDSLQTVKKSDISQSYDDKNLSGEDETSIYEYDVDCLKKKGYLDKVCNDSKK